MRWEPEEKPAPDWFVMCHECREPVDPANYDLYFDMCVVCRDFYELDEERDLERWQEHGGKCILCRKSFRRRTIARFRQGWVHWGCAEKFADALGLEAEIKRARGE